MKTLVQTIAVIIFFIIGSSVSAQSDCQVLLQEISETYTGKCKKGLAHGSGKATGVDLYEGRFKKGLPSGKGTYIWANGDVYEGEWQNGKRDGFGILHLKSAGKDSLIAGMWDKDVYKGPKPIPPKVVSSNNIDRYSFRRMGNGSRFSINLFMNGTRNSSVEGLSLIADSGAEYSAGQIIGYDNVEFPVNCKVSYTTWNKSHTSQYRARFEFVISQPGNWDITIHN